MDSALYRRNLTFDQLNACAEYPYMGVTGPSASFGPRPDYWDVEYHYFDATNGVQFITAVISGDRWYRVFNGGVAKDWKQIATATPPTEYDLPLVAGVVNIPGGYKSTYGKDQFGKVIINLFLDHADGSAFKTWHEVLANLPTGYRPTQNANVVGVATSNASSSPIGFAVLPDGTIRIYPFSVTETRVTATFVFQAGN